MTGSLPPYAGSSPPFWVPAGGNSWHLLSLGGHPARPNLQRHGYAPWAFSGRAAPGPPSGLLGLRTGPSQHRGRFSTSRPFPRLSMPLSPQECHALGVCALNVDAGSARPLSTPQVLTVDARNHGDSPHSPDMSYEAMSQDLQDLLPQLGLVPCVLIGHSMGGKTAMLLALQRPELVERLIAVDISPVETTPSSNFPSYMAAMRAVDIPDGVPRSSARKLADEQLSTVIQDLAERQFLLTNLVEADGRFMWRVNLEALAQHLDKIMAFPPQQESYPGPTLFLLGGNSKYVRQPQPPR
ncbi:protein ABHD11 isoform X3 [Enhydra lutris kenyoni]|uniref:sn-1-specific diacylglycerol lipase ABHD11 n=1 Tax=Enhydra lutris kenyoni TaxID=391180 RepID=A0A2Y9JI93_ENHLU|nr:protein ABHD11 isoform X3 [Enhydra lutris kenyoni]